MFLPEKLPARLIEALARAELELLEAAGLKRTLEPLATAPGAEIRITGPRGEERLINFSSNDYLGLAADPRISAALAEGAAIWGSGAGASRLVSGDFTVTQSLEAELAEFEGTESALFFNSGFAANCGLIASVVNAEDVVFSDALNHASIIDGCRLSRAEVCVYPHLDLTALESLLQQASRARRRLVVTDSVFSMDGDLAPLEGLVSLCEKHRAMLVVDEAHATGVLGPQGRGLVSALGLGDKVDARMATLSKAAGVVGAHVCGPRALRELLINKARPFVFSTALPPAISVAARVALALLSGPVGDERRKALRRNIDRFCSGLRALGFPAEARSAIFPVVLGSPQRSLQAASSLRARGLLVKPIRPPTVPAGTSRLRFALSAAHTDAHLDLALDALKTAI
jgi:8-amino-7-oxononanoate synthase